MRQISLALALLALTPGSAEAAAWQSKTMQAPMAAREVSRSLHLPKGWAEFSLSFDYKLATGSWGSDGVMTPFDNADFLYTTQRISARYGFTNSTELFISVPINHYISLTNELNGTDTSGNYPGDPSFGFRMGLLDNDLPLTSVIFQAEMKVPAGNEDPGSYIAGPSVFSQFITTTGTQDLSLSLAAKRQVTSNIAVGAHVGYNHRFSSIVHYLIELGENQGAGRIKPGAQTFAGATLTAQAGPVALSVSPTYLIQNEVRVGTTSGGLSPDSQLEPVEGSGGDYLDVSVGMTAHLNRNIDLSVGANIPIIGEDLMFFPIEDIHPTYGNTYSGTFTLRY
jgi:hypothetical protein